MVRIKQFEKLVAYIHCEDNVYKPIITFNKIGYS